ncbi:MAG: translocation/assembly module TamB domain-containing protein [Acidobacteria bacterium]|nr:translocation/assembly module TamB domain-containing protein [Acidobacteriota bacterium]
MSATPERPTRRRKRRLAVAAAVLLLLPLLLVGGGVLALRSAAVRQRLLHRVTAEAESRFGVHVTARDFSLDARRGTLDVHGLTVGAPGAAPFLTVEHLRAEVDVASLRRDTIVARSVLVEAPRIDLGAPIPTLNTAPGPATGPGRRVDVLEARLTGGSVVNGAVPARLAPWVSGWTVTDLGARGSYRDDRAVVELLGATFEATKPQQPPVRLTVTAAATVAGEEVTVSSLAIRGDGVDVRLSGEGRLGDAPAFGVAFELAVEPDAVAPELHAGGRVAASGQVAWPALTGHVAAEAIGVAAEAARPWVDAALFDRLNLAGSTVDATADVVLPGPTIDAASGTLAATWRREGIRLGTLVATVPPHEERGGAATAVEVVADLLPDSPGTRHLDGVVELREAGGSRTIALRRSRLELASPDLAATYGELRNLFPGLVPPADPSWPLIGTLEATVEANGPLDRPVATARAAWRPEAGARVTVEARGEPLTRRGEATVTFESLRLGTLRPGLAGTVSGTATAAGSPKAWRAEATVDGTNLVAAPDLPAIDTLHLHASTDGRTLDVHELAVSQGERRLTARGRAHLALPLRDAVFDVHVERPVPELAAADATLVLRDGVLSVRGGADTVAGPVAADVDVPLGALAAVPTLAEALRDAPVVRADGPVHARFAVPELDSCTLRPALGLGDREERVRASAAGELWVDLDDLTAAVGFVELQHLRAELPGHEVVAGGPVRLVIGGRRVAIEPVRLAADGVGIDLAASADLAARWDPATDDPAALVGRFEATARGALPAALLEPFLAGGQARGNLAFDLAASGTPQAPTGELRISGDGASLFWPTPYTTRIEEPRFVARLAGGDAVLESGTFRLHGGRAEVTGRRAADGTVTAELLLDAVRYRLDYGLRTVLSGGFSLTLPATRRGSLVGTLTVERGVLDRDIDLEREFLPRFLSPTPSTGTESGFLDTIDLDVSVDTLQGVRVKNNLADLRATWDRLTIGGTAWNPVIRGEIEVDRGGLVYAYGQTVRLDRAVARFTGDPVNDPVLDIETTTSMEDPSIGQPPASAALLSGALEPEALKDRAAGAVSAGALGYLGERLASSLGLGRISVRPLLVFGETDPSARLTVEQSLSRYVSFAVSLDLRNAQRQTYLLGLHGLDRLPTLTAQVFTNDTGGQGVTVQQSLVFGGPRQATETSPRLDKLVIDAPEQAPRKALRRAARVRRGDPVTADLPFDLEVELAQTLRDRGFPDAEVRVWARPSTRKSERVDLVVAVVPGPRATFDFVGDRPPKGLRGVITGLYRTDGYEAASIDEMRRATVRALRSVGFLEPDVEIEVRRERPDDATSDRAVAIRATGGRRAALATVEFTGLPAEEGQLLARRFPTPLERAELAAAVPDADRRALATLAALGWRDAAIASRALAEDGERLTVQVEPGTRTMIGEVAVSGLGPDEAARALGATSLREGEPARADRVAAATLTLEDRLRARGFGDAVVRGSLRDSGPHEVAVTLVVAPGTASRIAAVEFAGMRWTSASLARRAADLAPGQPFDPGEVRRARGRLLDLGVLTGVGVTTTKRPDGTTAVTFTATEAPRFSLAYGVRWESDQGLGAVVDYTDRNLFGRTLILGVRGLYTRNWSEPAPDEATDTLHELTGVRVFLAAPDVLGTGITSEVFGDVRRELSWGGLVTDRKEAAIQFSRPIGRDATARIYGRYRDTHLYEEEPDPFFPFDLRISYPYVGVQAIVDRRDDPVLTWRGWMATLDLSGSATFLGSDYEYLRAFAQLNTFTPFSLASRRVTWAQSVRVGLANSFDQELLPDARFRAGGEFSVRGYPSEGLGPVEELGTLVTPVGGAALLVINEELRVPLPLDLTGIVFVDAGQVWAETSEFGRDLATALGLGLRASTPLGLFRFDVAYPFDPRPGDASYKLYFGFGNVF